MHSTSNSAESQVKNNFGQAFAALRVGMIATAIIVVPWTGGCSTVNYSGAGAERTARLPDLPAPKFSLNEIVTFARQGVAADALIARIRAAGAYYRLSAADIISLRERGVPMPVLDHMLASEREFLAGADSNSAGKEQERYSDKRPKPAIRALYHGF